jgi:hypothetical protein
MLSSQPSLSQRKYFLEISSIKEFIQAQGIQRILWSATKKQLADYLTKNGGSGLVLLKEKRRKVMGSGSLSHTNKALSHSAFVIFC